MPARSPNDPEFRDITPKPRPRRRFKLVKFLTALGIIALLIALLLPAPRSAREAARRSQCVNNLKQIGIALHNYEQAYGALPPSYTVDAVGRPLHSWRTLILPYLEQEPLYRTIDLAKPWDDPANAEARATVVPNYHCPSSSEFMTTTTTYLAIVARGGCFPPGVSRRLSEITDGTASTLMVIEADAEYAVPWMAPVDADEAAVLAIGPTAKLHHPGGVNAAFVDGSVRFLKATTRAVVRRALVSVAGGDPVSADAY